MICLAVNTATSVLSVALAELGRDIDFFSTPETRDQGNLLLGNIQSLLQKNKLDYTDLGLLAVVTGPGSFTGIRIGIAAMRGIAMAAAKPIVGFSSFDLFGGGDITAIESWRDEIYLQIRGQAPVNLSPQEFSEGWSGDRKNIRITGDAREKLRPFFPDAVFAEKDPDARDLAQMALAKGPSDAQKPVPFYLRPADVTIGKGNRKVEA